MLQAVSATASFIFLAAICSKARIIMTSVF